MTEPEFHPDVRIGHVHLRVSNLARATAFYRETLGFSPKVTATLTAMPAPVAGAIVVFEPINQISRARNTGAARATGDWLLFTEEQPSVLIRPQDKPAIWLNEGTMERILAVAEELGYRIKLPPQKVAADNGNSQQVEEGPAALGPELDDSFLHGRSI